MIAKKGLKPSSMVISPIHLSRRLGEIEESLFNVGIKVKIGKAKRKRYVSICRTDEKDEARR